MQVKSAQIAEWARTKQAQAALPRLARRLIHTTGTITQVSIPAGDSTSQPGWDGELLSEHGSPWVPKGKSFWEMSCEGNSAGATTSKANRDYQKRLSNTPKKIRKSSTYLAITGRSWSTKSRWLQKKRAAGDWADVRAYDADDLEQWLEQSPAVALQFAEELGLAGEGVESAERHWTTWSSQTDPPISADAFFADRQEVCKRFIANLTKRLESGQQHPYAIRADSVEEAAAFACAAILSEDTLSVSALVVINESGWRFVEQNQNVRIAIAARPEVAQRPTQGKGVLVVIPYAAGDMAGYFRGPAGREDDADLVLERSDSHEFENALVAIGLDEGDARRLATTTGRSWSVFRRRHATNPAIRSPAWLHITQAHALSTLCLLGGWSAAQVADRQIVSRLSGRSYEEVERDLRFLARLDDSPILDIGGVWKAKSALELLDLFGDQITRDQLDRFFEIAQEILATPAPELDLPEEERYAAQVHGKVRPQSDLLINSLCDTLIKLGVRGPEIPALAAGQIEGRVAVLVRDLLRDADGTRWLSLASFLPALAEAAPNEFLQSVEMSLPKSDAPVTKLLTETSGSGFMGRCWHAGLLWALETLAWAPERLTRVALVLAGLSHVKIKGNWANSPKSSLVDLVRSWLPQTAASIGQRIALLDTLIERDSDVAFDVLDDLVHAGPDSASPTARPKWRDDDAGAGRGVAFGERQKMIDAAADRLIVVAEDNPERIARLISKISIFDPPRVCKTLELVESFTGDSASDRDKNKIGKALRHLIYWHRNYDQLPDAALNKKLRPIEELYERLVATNLIQRHEWLFSDAWPELPVRVRDEDLKERGELVQEMRGAALREIYEKHGWAGVEELVFQSSGPWQVGVSLAKLDLSFDQLARWIVQNSDEISSRPPIRLVVSGLLCGLDLAAMLEVIGDVLKQGEESGWEIDKIVQLLALAPEEKAVWDLIESLGQETEHSYWSLCSADFWPRDNETELEFALRRLLDADRPRTALNLCRMRISKVDSGLLTEMLERLLKDEETDGPLLDSYHMGEAFERLEEAGEIDRDRLIRLEFGLFSALGHRGHQRAKTLYDAIMSDPKLFTELICLLYKPAHGERGEPPTESSQAAAENAWDVLHHCHQQPGTQADGRVEHEVFVRFVDEVRELCRKADRLDACDSTLGQIMAHAPSGTDGVWPFEPARDVLDRPESNNLRRAFAIGAKNKRGVTSRAYDEGGVQERDLAGVYRGHAQGLQSSHPRIASTLDELTRWYEDDGVREDLEAQLRREGH